MWNPGRFFQSSKKMLLKFQRLPLGKCDKSKLVASGVVFNTSFIQEPDRATLTKDKGIEIAGETNQ